MNNTRDSANRLGLRCVGLLLGSAVGILTAAESAPSPASAPGANSRFEAAFAQPQAGDVFREYLWTNQGGDAGGSLRVGGRVGYGGGPIVLTHDFDLRQATKAEIVIEKLLCHDGTRGLAISVNNNEWMTVPEAPGVAEPPWDYQHHIYPVVAVPLVQLKAGTGNQFRLRVSDEHPWKWPQNLIYGVHFRIYYDPLKKPHPSGNLVSPSAGAALPVKPYDVPKKWVTRSGEKAEKFRIRGVLGKAVAAQLVWVSWSPGYMEGILVNDRKIFDREGPRYAYCTHRVTLSDMTAFKPGENVLKTALTPKHDGEMVHGMEVNWPGIMVLIQYR